MSAATHPASNGTPVVLGDPRGRAGIAGDLWRDAGSFRDLFEFRAREGGAAAPPLSEMGVEAPHVRALDRPRKNADHAHANVASGLELLAAQQALLFLQSVHATSLDWVEILDLEGRVELMDVGGQKAMEVDDPGAVIGCAWTDCWEGDEAPKAMAALSAAQAGRTLRFDGFRPTMRGTPKWWDVQITPIRDKTGEPVKLMAMSHDITELQLAAQRERMLLKELEHRCKNMLAMVGAVVCQTLRHAGTPAGLRETIQERLVALSRANDVLTSRNWTAASIASVVRAVVLHDSEHDQISASGPDVELPANQALALTLAFHELGTNAVKYGALSTETGRVDVSWSVVGSGSQRQLSLSWVEQGGPPVKQPTARGFGSCLIEDALASAFRGTPKLTFDPAGVRWMLVAPVTAVGAQSACSATALPPTASLVR